MNFILLSSIILASISGLFALTRQLQMLQQNSYFPSRYCPWVKDGYSVFLSIETILFCLSSLFFSNKFYIAQFVLIILLLIARIVISVGTQKKSVKKLAVTARIKRLYLAAFLIYALLIVLYCFIPNELFAKIFLILGFMLAFVSPLITLLVWLITFPIEKAVNKWYVNDAKRILKSHKNLIVIGVTGSYGKTSVKFILKRILSEKFNVVATPQSFNTPMGVVRTIRNDLKPQTQIFICEMGAKNIGDIKEICQIVHPQYGIITSVGPQHLDTFKSIENVFNTKFELTNEVFKNNGTVFVNGDSEEIINRIEKEKFSVYGTDNSFNYTANNMSYGKNGSNFSINFGTEDISLSSKLLGRHSIINIVGAAAVGYELGVSLKDIKYAVSTLKPTEHRLELKPHFNGSVLIDDAYNANPEGSIEAVNVVASFEGMKKVIVTPGLIELGSKEYECNFNLGVKAARCCDYLIFVGLTRSKPLVDGADSVGFPKDKMFVVASFKDAMEIYAKLADNKTVVLFENDLPDNYLK